MKMIKASLAALTFAIAAPMAAPSFHAAFAQSVTAVSAEAETLPSGDFVRKSKRLSGSYEVIERDGQTVIVFSDDFRAARGPDLKVFLSPRRVADVNGNTATNGSILLGELSSTRGTQEYVVPAGVDLSAFGSLLVHCEEFAVLWGGSDL